METMLPAHVARRMFGRVPVSRVRTAEVPRHSPDLVHQMLALPDMTSAIADAMDELGVGAVRGRDSFTPLARGMRICGPAVTLRYVPVDGDPSVNRHAAKGLVIGDRDLYGVAEAGDVAVFDCSGLRSAAVLGGLSAHWAAKAGLAGALVDGATRDTATVLASGLAVWEANRTPQAARYRVEAVSINDEVGIAGMRVGPGDYVIADDDGVCITPHDDFPAVVAACVQGQGAEDELLETIRTSADLHELVGRTASAPVPD